MIPLCTPVFTTGWVLGYRPFLDPLDVHDLWWVFIVPLAVLLAMGYKAVRLPTLDKYWRHVALFAAQTLLGIGGLAVALHLFVRLVLPAIAPMPGG